NGRSESPLGRSENPCRTPEARHRRRRAHRLSAAALTLVAYLANVPDQPCPRPLLDRRRHRSHRSLACPLRLGHPRPPPPAPPPLQRDRASHRRLDRPAARRYLPRRLLAALSPPRSRQHLRSRVPATSEGHGDL